MNKYRFAAYAFLYDSQKWILRMIENCAPHVEKIYIAYSTKPWTYNPSARNNFTNTADPGILKQSKFYDKIELITGEWDTDEGQRNACLEKARKDGFDFLIIQDADEFFRFEDYKKMIREISENPDYDFYKTKYSNFWKTFDYVAIKRNGSIFMGYLNFAINCKKDVNFYWSRIIKSDNYLDMNYHCFHGSYVLSDEELYRKIMTWGHTHQFNPQRWYERKWLKWNEATRNLCPVLPGDWKKAVKYEGTLPEVLQDFESPPLNIRQLKPGEKIAESILELGENLHYYGVKVQESVMRFLAKVAPEPVKRIYKKLKKYK